MNSDLGLFVQGSVADDISTRSVTDNDGFVFLTITPSLTALGMSSGKGSECQYSVSKKKRKKKESIIELMSGCASLYYP